MLKLDRPTANRVLGEGAIIVISILLALYADAWLDDRKQAAQLEGQLAALQRDFETMLVRVDASHDSASRGAAAGRLLSELMQSGARIDTALAAEKLWHLVFYEVFTPSLGAYHALVDSGNLGLLKDAELKLELADFFGSFEDVRASEKLQLDTQIAVFGSETFSELAGWHRLGQAEVPVAGDLPVERWSESDQFMNAVGILTVRQYDVLEDYRFLRNRIRRITAAIEVETAR
ncbi:MAG TPA: hypothetical protein VIS76_09485 [Pseudomonadales bacterium]